jgi:hypothetical protein
MNEKEKERILAMLAEGTLSAADAARLLAALSEHPAAPPPPPQAPPTPPEPPKPMTEVKLQRSDGTYYTVNVPPDLMPMLWTFTKAAIKETVRTAATETVAGLKTMARNKAEEVKTTVKASVQTRVTRPAEPPAPPAPPVPPASDARRQILQMVQNGRISAAEASRLIEQIDALSEGKAA